MIIEFASHMFAADVFIYAQIIDVKALYITKHGIFLDFLDHAKAVTQHFSVLHTHKNGTGFVLQQFLQVRNAVFLSACPEQVRADLVVDFSHLFQQFDHAGNVSIVCKTDFHRSLPSFILIMIYHITNPPQGKAERKKTSRIYSRDVGDSCFLRKKDPGNHAAQNAAEQKAGTKNRPKQGKQRFSGFLLKYQGYGTIRCHIMIQEERKHKNA
jgi:hypothetical protein